MRASLLAHAVTALAWSDCGVEGVAPYTWMSAEDAPADADQWFGLWSPRRGLTPAGAAYGRVLRAEVGRRNGGAAPLCSAADGLTRTVRGSARAAAARAS